MHQRWDHALLPSLQIKQVIILIPTPFPPADHNLLLTPLVVFLHRPQQLLQLLFRHLRPQLARPRQHDQPILHVDGAGLFDQADAPQTIGGFGQEDLREDGSSGVGCARQRILSLTCPAVERTLEGRVQYLLAV